VGYPDRVRRSIAIATCGYFSGDQIAWSVPQLAAIRADGNYRGGDYYDGEPPLAGMAVAREIAHTTYRSALELDTRFNRDYQGTEDPLLGGRYAVQSYLEHHGRKLGRRFDPNSYLALTEAMNSHDIGRGRGGVDAALQQISAELTVAVVDSDRLFLPAQGALLATAPTARDLITIHSDYGHDGFLIEAEAIAGVVRDAVA
jgi:homoserine O-acetyltransferase